MGLSGAWHRSDAARWPCQVPLWPWPVWLPDPWERPGRDVDQGTLRLYEHNSQGAGRSASTSMGRTVRSPRAIRQARVGRRVLSIGGGPLVSLAVATNVLSALTGSASGGLTNAAALRGPRAHRRHTTLVQELSACAISRRKCCPGKAEAFRGVASAPRFDQLSWLLPPYEEL
jgi:hypothetical protein